MCTCKGTGTIVTQYQSVLHYDKCSCNRDMSAYERWCEELDSLVKQIEGEHHDR